jgi:hypothetical protein
MTETEATDTHFPFPILRPSIGGRHSRNSTLVATRPIRWISPMPRPVRIFLWLAISLLGAAAVGVAAFERNEPVNALWLVVAGVRTIAAYRFDPARLVAGRPHLR